MKTKICSSFWDDPAIEETDANTRLTALWLETNARVSLFGYAEITERRFEFETGLPALALAKTLEALPKRYRQVGYGYWVVNYIREQFGEGEALARNNMFRAIVRSLEGCACKEAVECVLREYPVFQRGMSEALENPSASPTQGQRVRVGVRAGASVGAGRGKGQGPAKARKPREPLPPPSLEEWLAKARALHPDWPEIDAQGAWSHYVAKAWEFTPGNPVRNWVGCIGTCYANWRKSAKNLAANDGGQAEFAAARSGGFEDVTAVAPGAGGAR